MLGICLFSIMSYYISTAYNLYFRYPFGVFADTVQLLANSKGRIVYLCSYHFVRVKVNENTQ